MRFSGTIRKLVAAGLVLSVFAGAMLAILRDGGQSGVALYRAGDPALPEAALASESELIIVGEFIREERRRVEIRSPVVRHTGDFRTDVYRTFRVTEVRRGRVESAEVVVVHSVRIEDTTRGNVIEYHLAPAEQGVRYVLYLSPLSPSLLE